jgi:hypothetical protein
VRVGTPEPAEPSAPAPAPPPAQEQKESRPAPPAEPPRTAEPARVPEARSTAASLPADVPELTLLRLRWHPEARRRSVSLSYEAREIEDAREGDMIEGIEIEEILPDAIVVRAGDELHRVALRP